MVGIQLECTNELSMSSRPIPIYGQEIGGKSGVSVCRAWVEEHGSLRRFFSSRIPLILRERVKSHERAVTIGICGVGRSVAGIVLRGLTKIFTTSFPAIGRPLVPVVYTF